MVRRLVSGVASIVTLSLWAAGCGGGSPSEVRVTFASGPDWLSYAGDLSGADGGTLGPAQAVCVNEDVPSSCPAGALRYGKAQTGGWSATLSLVADAQWVWQGDVAVDRTSDLEFAVFEKRFSLGDGPTGTIEVAADDLVEVLVNGSTVGTAGSVSDMSVAFLAQSSRMSLDVTPFLHPGDNTLTIVAQNGPPSFAGCPSACTFASNTAGVLFGGVLTSH